MFRPDFGTDGKRGSRMAIKSPQELLDLLQQSRLLSPEQLDDVRDSMLLTNDVAKLLDMLVARGVLTEWQKTQLLAGRTGFFIGNYVLLGLLGRGGMGSVFLGRHTTMNRRCAVKVVSKKVGKDPDSLDQFLTEARAIASLDHPNIVQAYDVDKENDHFYIVMEYVEGQSLEEIINIEGVLDCESAVDCIRQAAAGLAHAHSRNMVHCDIKPSNLLVNEQGVVKILDMGMARLVGESGISNSDSRSNEKILGTVDYMAPEQAVAAPNFDFRADVYSLGCTLFALLVGHPPFNEGTLTQRILKHQTQDPPSLRRFRQDVPVNLADICMKMMAKDPADRYQTAQEVVDVLSDWTMPEEPITPEKIQNEPPPLPAANAFDEATLGAEVVAGPALETKHSKKKSFWEDERFLLPILGVIVVIVLGLLFLLFIASSRNNDVPNNPSNTTVAGSDTPDSTTHKAENTQDAASDITEPDSGTTDSGKLPSGESNPPAEPDKSDFEVVKPTPEETKPSESTPKSTPSTPEATSPTEPIQEQVNPLARLPQSVDLPLRVNDKASDPTRPLPLGCFLFAKDDKAAAEEAKLIQIKLIGGEAVLAQHAFTIVKTPSNGLPKWTVQLAWNHTEVEVARLWIEKDNNLMFRWLNHDQNVPAGYLSLCVLEITDGPDTHKMQLSTLRQIPGLKINPIQNVHVSDFKPSIVPDTDSLRLELTSYKGPFKNVTYDPSPVLKANTRTTTATLSGNGLPTLTISFEYFVKGHTVQLKAWCWYSPQGAVRGGRRIPVSLENTQRLDKFLADLVYQRRKILSQNTPNEKQAEKIAEIDEEYKQLMKLAEIFKTLSTYTKPSDIPEDFEGLGTFQFREYIQAGNEKIELMKTN